jgi:hypothetical protein
MNIAKAIELLKNYSGPYELTLHIGADDTQIQEIEGIYNITFPSDFKTFYRFTDGFEIDEDIFNMIKLGEMLGNKKDIEPDLWIAEYMIYSDMWSLEIDPKNPDDYTIFVVDGHYGKIPLTNSLGEFITRVLNNGVFEIGGLYHLQDEVKAKIYGNTKPNEIKPLLGVFYQCLELGLIPHQEIADWAKWVISSENDPHPFFIEMAASNNQDTMLGILSSMELIEDILQTRVIFGITRHQLYINKINHEKALFVLNKYADKKEFVPYENKEIQYLVEQQKLLNSQPNAKLQRQINERVNLFFDNYSYLNIHNYKMWDYMTNIIFEKFRQKD